MKDPIPGGLRSCVVYKFAYAGCNACVGETTRHFSTRVCEHLVISHFKHLANSEHCRALCSVDCFHILDHAPTTFQLKIKEEFHIQREQPSAIASRKSEIILLILTLPHFMYSKRWFKINLHVTWLKNLLFIN